MASFSSKVYLVIGSTSGIGLSTANALIDRGAKVAFADVDLLALEDAIKSMDSQKRGNSLLVKIDITNHESVHSAIESTKQHFGKLDGIANIAGVGGHHFGKQPIWENGLEEYDFVMNVNVRGIFNVLNLALVPGVLETPGSIVHVTSVYSLRGCKNAALYSASKHAAVGLIKSAAIESGSNGIRVNAVLP
jgi:NAD(P)-dependent dehydrogenase (short-subunit alcohol dehydrogenase family)